MANNFKSSMSKNVGTSAVSAYTVPSSTVSTLIGCSLANTSASPVSVDIFITRSGVDYYIVKNATVPFGSSFIWAGGDQKVIVMTNDVVKVVSSAASSVDAVLSYLEMS